MLVIAYDGTNYCGWQVEPNGVSIQSTLQDALEDLLGERVNVTGASRTDSGVHALGQVAVFDTEMSMPDWKFAYAINQRLPDDIVVQSSKEVSADFHPRYTHKIEKVYEYRIMNSRMPQPCGRMYSFFVPQKLDVDLMRKAARLLVGEHDFRSFSSGKTKVTETVRTIYSFDIITEGDMITLRIRGNGFLYKMVRVIAGTLVKVGKGQKTVEDVENALKFPVWNSAGPTAPARGLTLISIKYG